MLHCVHQPVANQVCLLFGVGAVGLSGTVCCSWKQWWWEQWAWTKTRKLQPVKPKQWAEKKLKCSVKLQIWGDNSLWVSYYEWSLLYYFVMWSIVIIKTFTSVHVHFWHWKQLIEQLINNWLILYWMTSNKCIKIKKFSKYISFY